MKIAIYNDWWFPDLVGGAEKSSKDNFDSLKKLGHDIKIFKPVNCFRFKPGVVNNVFLIPTLTLRQKPQTSFFIKAIEKIRVFFDLISPLIAALRVKVFKPEILVVHQIDRIGPYFITFTKLLLPKIRIIRIYHDLGDSCLLRTRFRFQENCKETCLMCRPKNNLNRILSKYIDLAVYNSEFTSGEYKGLGYRAKSFRVGLPYENQNKGLTYKTTVNTSRFLEIAYVGRLHPTKGIEFLMECASKVDEIQLHILGTGDRNYENKLADLSKDLNLKVQNHGFVNEPFLFLQRIGVQLVVVPSKWNEPFGRIPLESASYGIQSISSESGGLKESQQLIEPALQTFKFGDHKTLISLLENAKIRREKVREVRIKDFESIFSVIQSYITRNSG